MTATKTSTATLPASSRVHTPNEIADELQAPEIKLIQKIAARQAASRSSLAWGAIDKIEQRSPEPYDLTIAGTTRPDGAHAPYRFGAWLPLAAIAELVDWTSEPIASMTDYPQMAAAGDWSGVRDTNREAIWRIFREHVLKAAAAQDGAIGKIELRINFTTTAGRKLHGQTTIFIGPQDNPIKAATTAAATAARNALRVRS